jgi:glucan phosphoethanolaminetransferase (alkaline phosphatase superfamily)
MIVSLILGLVVFAVICLWVLIEERKSPKFLVWFIPLFLVLVSSTYVTYTSILGYPKVEKPKEGLYLKHYIDEPNWIYLWVVYKEKIPISYQLVYSRETHKALEGVKEKSEQEGKFMVLREKEEGVGNKEGKKEQDGGITIGGDISFYEWDYKSNSQEKNPEENR